MTTLVSHHGSVGGTVISVQVLNHPGYDARVLGMFGLGGLVAQAVNLVDDEVHRLFVFLSQVFVRNGYAKSMASVFFVPGVIA